jgi:hypothetical protein
VENGRVLAYCVGDKGNISEATASEYLHPEEWWALPAHFMNCISDFILLQYYEETLRFRFKMNAVLFTL